MRVRLSGRGLAVQTERVRIPAGTRHISTLVVRPRELRSDAPGVLWLHGGGFATGMKEMVFMSRAIDLVTQFGAVVVAPDYRLSWQAPYPAALHDCYAVLLWMRDHAGELGVDSARLVVGGESAGGGLTASLCMLARDAGQVKIAFQMPLYPMLDNLDTESSRDNHARVWNTRRNHQAWYLYLRQDALSAQVSPYAAAARQTDYRNLPPAYTFVSTAEPFYAETLAYVEALRAAGVPAEVDVYEGLYHAFDMMEPNLPQSREARQRFIEKAREALGFNL